MARRHLMVPAADNKELIRIDSIELANSFLAGRTEQTRRAYQQDLSDFSQCIGASSIEDACKFLVMQSHGDANRIALAYKARLIERRLSPATVNRRLSSLRSIVAYANTCGLVSWKLSVRNERNQKYKDTTGVTVPMFRSLLEAAGAQTEQAKACRDVAILRLCFDLALRRNEVRQLDFPTDIDFQEGFIWIQGKGNREKQKLSLPQKTSEALQAWVKHRGDYKGPLFLQLSRAIKEKSRISNRGLTELVRTLGKKINLQLSIHTLRHTSLTQAIKSCSAAGIDITEVLHFSRHSKSSGLSTLMIYRDNDRNCQRQISELVSSEA